MAPSIMDVNDLIKKRDKYYNNSEFRAAKAVGLQHFDDDGYLNLETKNSTCSIKKTSFHLIKPIGRRFSSLVIRSKKWMMLDALS